jgi:MoaA/NifB/PqqE/SkfB family radical SAM enzyme
MSFVDPPVQIYNFHHNPEPDFEAGVTHFFRLCLSPEPGDHAALMQLQLPDGLASAEVRLQARDAFTGATLAELDLRASRADLEALDDPILYFRTQGPCAVEFLASSAGFGRSPLLRHLNLRRWQGDARPTRAAFRDEAHPFQTHRLHTVQIGSTNICNASCPHCPANKPMLAGVPAGVMNMETFDKLLDGLESVETIKHFWFGVFGEPFVDETLEAKLDALRRRFPRTHVGVSTNAGALDLERAAAIIDKIDLLQIHVEAVTPARYDALMHPLRAAEVLPKVDAIAGAFARKASIIAPLHRGNFTEAEALKDRFAAKGVRVEFAPFHNRSTSRTGGAKLALWPAPGFWLPDLIEVLTVDWDGEVLATCEDFLRRQPLGSLRHQTLPQILDGAPRRALHDDLSAFRWARLPSFRDAMIDSFSKAATHAAVKTSHAQPKRTLRAQDFKVRDDLRRDGDRIIVDPPEDGAPLRPAVYGPYLKLEVGFYVVELQVDVTEGSPRRLFADAIAFGHRIYRVQDAPPEGGAIRLRFAHDRSDKPVEFRVFVEDFAAPVTLDFRGGTLLRLGDLPPRPA